VEAGVGHAKRTPLKGQRFESLEQAQAYLDRWEAHWADTRIHGTTKRQVAAMFTDEHLHLPSDPAWRRAVVGGFHFHTTIQMDHALTVLIKTERFERQS
jgi:hypothetical protein